MQQDAVSEIAFIADQAATRRMAADTIARTPIEVGAAC
jgi:hypothetical protein